MDKLNKKPIDLNYPDKRSLLDHKNHKVIFNDMEKPYGPKSYGFYYNIMSEPAIKKLEKNIKIQIIFNLIWEANAYPHSGLPPGCVSLFNHLQILL